MYLAAMNRRPNTERLKQAGGSFPPLGKKSGAKQPRPPNSPGSPSCLCCPEPVALGLAVAVWLCCAWSCLVVCAGKGGEQKLFPVQDFAISLCDKGFSLLDLPWSRRETILCYKRFWECNFFSSFSRSRHGHP